MTRTRTPSVRGALEHVTEREFVTELGVVVAMLVALRLYDKGLNAVLDPFFLDSDPALTAVRGAFVLAGTSCLAVAYALRRGHSLPFALPDRSDGTAFAAAVLAAVAIGAAVWLPVAVEVGFPVESLVHPLSSLENYVLSRHMVRIVVFAPASALVFHALVQSGFRRILDRKLAILTTALLGAYVTSSILGAGTPLWLALSPERAFLATLVVAALAVAAHARGRTRPAWALAGAGLAVLIAFAWGVQAVHFSVDTIYELFDALGRGAIVGVGAYAYDRTDSVVPATFAYVAFSVVNYYFLSVSLHAAFGGAF